MAWGHFWQEDKMLVMPIAFKRLRGSAVYGVATFLCAESLNLGSSLIFIHALRLALWAM